MGLQKRDQSGSWQMSDASRLSQPGAGEGIHRAMDAGALTPFSWGFLTPFPKYDKNQWNIMEECLGLERMLLIVDKVAWLEVCQTCAEITSVQNATLSFPRNIHNIFGVTVTHQDDFSFLHSTMQRPFHLQVAWRIGRRHSISLTLREFVSAHKITFAILMNMQLKKHTQWLYPYCILK